MSYRFILSHFGRMLSSPRTSSSLFRSPLLLCLCHSDTAIRKHVSVKPGKDFLQFDNVSVNARFRAALSALSEDEAQCKEILNDFLAFTGFAGRQATRT